MKCTLNNGTVSYWQDADDCDDIGDPQELTIHIDDGGAGKYFAIETKRWAFDDIKEVLEVLIDAGKRLGIEVEL